MESVRPLTVKPTDSQNAGARDPVPPVMRQLASALFVDPVSVNHVARYLVSHYATPDKPSLRLMDELAFAILHGPFSLRLYGERGLADASSTKVQFVLALEVWHGLCVALPLEYAYANQMLGLVGAVRDMVAPPTRPRFYAHVRCGDVEGEYIHECLTEHAARTLGQHAWPSLLLTRCYYYYAEMLKRAVGAGHISSSFALDAVRSSSSALETVLAQPADAILTLRKGCCLAWDGLTASVLHGELTALHAILVETELGSMVECLRLFSGDLASQCTHERM